MASGDLYAVASIGQLCVCVFFFLPRQSQTRYNYTDYSGENSKLAYFIIFRGGGGGNMFSTDINNVIVTIFV